MGVQTLGIKKVRKCEAVLGLPVIRAHTHGRAGVAVAWVDNHNAAIVDWKNKFVLSRPEKQGCFVAFVCPYQLKAAVEAAYKRSQADHLGRNVDVKA